MWIWPILIGNVECFMVSETQIVLSGTEKAVEELCSLLHTKGVAGRGIQLPVSGPFHCRLMNQAQATMRKALQNVAISMPITDVISNVTHRPVRLYCH